jgi:phosphatidylserine decarboxylase
MIRLTRYGWPQIFIFPSVFFLIILLGLFVGTALLPGWALWTIEAIAGIFFVFTISFFRDPERVITSDKGVFLAPADGKITNIDIIENDYIGQKAVKFGIFLSIFDVHINRSPCNVKVYKISYKKGSYKNAAYPASGQVNESNDLYLIRADNPQDKLVVRQISGAIARRIVCRVTEGQYLAGGEHFGMIKFGSRTELLVPCRNDIIILAKVGDKVKAGISVLARYKTEG